MRGEENQAVHYSLVLPPDDQARMRRFLGALAWAAGVAVAHGTRPNVAAFLREYRFLASGCRSPRTKGGDQCARSA